MNKQLLIGLSIIFLVLPIASSLELKMLSENNQEENIFSPGSKVIFQAKVPEDVSTVTLVVLKDNTPIYTDRMKILSENEFALAYEIPDNFEQGDYLVKILAKGEETLTTSSELYIGQEIQLEFIEKTADNPHEEKLSFFQKIWNFIKGIFTNE